MKSLITVVFQFRAVVFLVSTMLLVGCVLVPPVKELTDLSQVKDTEVVLVGKIELDPPLQPGEQQIDSGPFLDKNLFLNKVGVAIDPKNRVFKSAPGLGEVKTYFEATFGENFFVLIPKKTMYINFIGFHLIVTQGGSELHPLPAGLKIEIKPGDEAVYMGTLHYKRNEFMDILKSSIVDEQISAQREFQKQFGTRMKLTKRLAVPVKKNK